MRKEASLNQWKELYDETLKLKALEPWKYLDSADLIAIKLQGMEEPVFMSVMGRLGTCYGVSMYEGWTDWQILTWWQMRREKMALRFMIP